MFCFRMPYYMHELNPDYNPATGMLHHMTTDELKKLLNDDDRLDAMIKDLQQVKLYNNFYILLRIFLKI